MTNRVYIMPTIGGGSPANKRRPKYADTVGVDGFGAMYYGQADTCITLIDAPDAVHTTIAANSDAFAAPLDLDQNLTGGAVSIVETFLENLDIPAQWVSTSLTYREVIRKVGHFFYFARKFSVISGGQRLLPAGYDLSNTWSQVPQSRRSDIQGTADFFGIDYSSVNGNSTVRAVLKLLADFWGQQPLVLHSVDI